MTPRTRWSLVVALTLLANATLQAEAAAKNPVRDAGHGLKLVAEDAWLAATSPVRLDRDGWIQVGKVMAIGGVLFAFDEQLYRAAQRNLDEPVIEQTHDVGDAVADWGLMGKTWPYYAGLMVVGYTSGQDRLTRIGGEILLAQWMGGALRNGVKYGLGRRRPNEGRGAYWFEFNGGTSLPSGHASSYFAAIEVLRLHADRWWITAPLYTTGVCLALQRTYSSQHWPSDAWIGAISGIVAARFVFGRHEPTPKEDARWSLEPASAPFGGAGIGLIRRF